MSARPKAKPLRAVGTVRKAERRSEAPRRVMRVRKAPPPGVRALRVPKPQAMLSEVLELSRRVPVDLHEDEIVHEYVTSFSRLFPKRFFCVRVFASRWSASMMSTTFW